MSIRRPIRGSRRYGKGSRDFGYAEGRNIQFEERWAEGRNDRLDGLAQELIDSKVDILVVMMGPALRSGETKDLDAADRHGGK